MLLLQLMIVIPDAARNLLRLIKSELYGVQTYDPLTFFAVLALLIIAATAATFLPTRRIANIDPASTLRAE